MVTYLFALTHNMEQREKLLLHVPHSSTSFPRESSYTFNDLDEDERLLIDYFTDELFIPKVASEKISYAVFPYCRLYCDVERLINDPLEARGLGFSYSREVPTADGLSVRLRSFGTKEDAFDHYVDFHAEVAKRLFRSGDNTLLIDCHSFSQHPNLLNPTPPDIDICIGFNDDETCPDETTIGIISQYFKSLGYKVGINEPFSNSKTFNVPIFYHSLMIELNKRLYMNEHTLEKTPAFDRLRQEIQGIFDLLIK